MAPSKVSIIVLCASLGAAAATVALAQTQEEWREAREEGAPGASALLLEQSYHGTLPGTGNALPRVEEIRSKPGNWITWPGFMMRPDGGSRLFIQTTKALTFVKLEKKNRLELQFRDTAVHLNNNRNPLITVNFNTPLKTAFLKRRAKRVDLVMELKVKAEAVISQYTDADGYCYLFVDFPPGLFSTGGDWRPQVMAGGQGGVEGISSDDYLRGLPAAPPQPDAESAAPGAPGGGDRAAPPSQPAPAVEAPPAVSPGGDEEPPAEAPESEIFPAT